MSAVRRAISVSIMVGEALQLAPVDADAGALHARQHAGQRQFDLGVQIAQAARFHCGREQLEEFERRYRRAARARRRA